jgi:hypothetical protein
MTPVVSTTGCQDSRGCPKSKANLFTFLKKDDSIKE